jgi:hypothetical protein
LQEEDVDGYIRIGVYDNTIAGEFNLRNLQLVNRSLSFLFGIDFFTRGKYRDFGAAVLGRVLVQHPANSQEYYFFK